MVSRITCLIHFIRRKKTTSTKLRSVRLLLDLVPQAESILFIPLLSKSDFEVLGGGFLFFSSFHRVGGGNLWHESQVTFSTCEHWDCRVLWHYLQLWWGFEYRPQMRGKSSKKILTRGLIFFWSLLWVRRTKTILFYFIKKIVGMVATCCQIAYEQHLSK
jgi:hypothetical protein